VLAISELQRSSQFVCRHSGPVIEYGDLMDASASAMSNKGLSLATQQLNIRCTGLNRIINQLSDRVSGVSVSVVPHRLYG